MDSNNTLHVESIQLATEQEKRVAYACVRVGDFLFRGITVYRSANGRLRVYLPSWRPNHCGGFEETLALPPEVRSEMEIAVLTAYKEKLKKASLEDKNAASGGDA